MGSTIAQKIIAAHLVSGSMQVGEDIGLRIDQTLTQDAREPWPICSLRHGRTTGKDRAQCGYIDHNTLQSGFEKRR